MVENLNGLVFDDIIYVISDDNSKVKDGFYNLSGELLYGMK